MKKIVSLLCAVLMIASIACLSAFAADPVVTVAAVPHDVNVGDTELVVDYVVTAPEGTVVAGMEVLFKYDSSVMVLAKRTKTIGYGIFSQNITDNPFKLAWGGVDAEDQIAGTGEGYVMTTLTFTLAAPATEGTEYKVDLELIALSDLYSADLLPNAVVENGSVVAAVPTTAPVTTEPAPTETATEAPATSATEAPAVTTKAPATEAPATTTTEAPATTKAPDKASQTGDMIFVVVAVMVVALGAAVVVKKVNVK